MEFPETTADYQTWGTGGLTLQTYLRQVAISAFGWSAMVVIEAAQVLLADASHGFVLPLFHYFIWAAFNWYSWALLTPFVLVLARRWPLTRTHWPRRILYPYLPACLILVCVHAAMRGAEGWIEYILGGGRIVPHKGNGCLFRGSHVVLLESGEELRMSRYQRDAVEKLLGRRK